ncbi:APOH protein, partial [Polypterus senegalus]
MAALRVIRGKKEGKTNEAPWPTHTLKGTILSPRVWHFVNVAPPRCAPMAKLGLALDGYFLHGQNTSHCKDDGTWDVGLPHCEPIFCPMPDIPHFGKIKHIRPMEGNKTRFGEQVQYECQPPFVLFGNETAFCQADGNWTEMPQCKKVSCSPPTSIPNGFMSFAVIREYGYQENIKYGCKPDFVLDGPNQMINSFNNSDVTSGVHSTWSHPFLLDLCLTGSVVILERSL